MRELRAESRIFQACSRRLLVGALSDLLVEAGWKIVHQRLRWPRSSFVWRPVQVCRMRADPVGCAVDRRVADGNFDRFGVQIASVGPFEARAHGVKGCSSQPKAVDGGRVVVGKRQAEPRGIEVVEGVWVFEQAAREEEGERERASLARREDVPVVREVVCTRPRSEGSP